MSHVLPAVDSIHNVSICYCTPSDGLHNLKGSLFMGSFQASIFLAQGYSVWLHTGTVPLSISKQQCFINYFFSVQHFVQH